MSMGRGQGRRCCPAKSSKILQKVGFYPAKVYFKVGKSATVKSLANRIIIAGTI